MQVPKFDDLRQYMQYMMAKRLWLRRIVAVHIALRHNQSAHCSVTDPTILDHLSAYIYAMNEFIWYDYLALTDQWKDAPMSVIPEEIFW